MRSSTASLAIASFLTSMVGAIPLTVRQGGDQPLVVAHQIVGLTAAYQVADWEADIKDATAAGIDGFALNVGKDDFTATQTGNAFTAATNVNKDFKLFFSFDMSAIPCAAAADAGFIVDLTKQFATKPNYLVFRGAPYVSTFAGEGCKFGAAGADDAGLNAAWEVYKSQLGGQKVHFAPAFFIDPTRFANLPVIDGAFNFNGGFTNTLKDNSDPALIAAAQKDTTAALQSDAAFTKALGAKSFMTGVSPWFFTHFSQQSFNKNFVFLMDNSAFTSRWQQLIGPLRNTVQIVQVVTWNDYGESHYVGPTRGAVPEEAKAWVDGFDHSGLLPIVQHFATAFKTGKEPAVTKDQIILQGRPHPKGAKASADAVGVPTTADLLSDNFFATVFATAPGQVVLSSAQGDDKSFDVQAGVTKLAHPLAPGGSMSATMNRGGKAVASVNAKGFTFNATPQKFNFNSFVVASQ